MNPKDTSQKCSGCDTVVKKSLSVRIPNCPDCGLQLDRDHNAAINIKKATVALRGGAVVANTPEKSRFIGNRSAKPCKSRETGNKPQSFREG
ncbi:transposase [Candidatus Poribacteria bacterium]|nr:transposase [Candidatus Poribacteria bacterium]